MTVTFTWNIAALERETDDGFVYTAHYTIDANDGTYSAGAYGSIGFERPEDLIPYMDLQKEQVIDWVVRYWEQAKKAGLHVTTDPADFYRDV